MTTRLTTQCAQVLCPLPPGLLETFHVYSLYEACGLRKCAEDFLGYGWVGASKLRRHYPHSSPNSHPLGYQILLKSSENSINSKPQMTKQEAGKNTTTSHNEIFCSILYGQRGPPPSLETSLKYLPHISSNTYHFRIPSKTPPSNC